LSGTSWFWPRRGAGSMSPRVPSDMRTGRRGAPLASALLAAILGLSLRVNLSRSAPRGLYRDVTGSATREGVGACLRESRGSDVRAYSRLPLAGPMRRWRAAVIKPVVALAGDLVELEPEAEIVNGQRLPGSSSADVERPRPAAAARALGTARSRR